MNRIGPIAVSFSEAVRDNVIANDVPVVPITSSLCSDVLMLGINFQISE